MTDQEFRDLVEQAHQVQELTREPGWQVLESTVNRRASHWNRRLLDGQADSVEEYRAWAGRIQGMREFLGLPDEFQQRVEAERKRREDREEAA